MRLVEGWEAAGSGSWRSLGSLSRHLGGNGRRPEQGPPGVRVPRLPLLWAVGLLILLISIPPGGTNRYRCTHICHQGSLHTLIFASTRSGQPGEREAGPMLSKTEAQFQSM